MLAFAQDNGLKNRQVINKTLSNHPIILSVGDVPTSHIRVVKRRCIVRDCREDSFAPFLVRLAEHPCSEQRIAGLGWPLEFRSVPMIPSPPLRTTRPYYLGTIRLSL